MEWGDGKEVGMEQDGEKEVFDQLGDGVPCSWYGVSVCYGASVGECCRRGEESQMEKGEEEENEEERKDPPVQGHEGLVRPRSRPVGLRREWGEEWAKACQFQYPPRRVVVPPSTRTWSQRESLMLPMLVPQTRQRSRRCHCCCRGVGLPSTPPTELVLRGAMRQRREGGGERKL